ncbi:hypothetical protein LCGC14_3161090 [marine sediment metagenome]|uniref:Uncharacterized protein n=1 Tax=marine sediment metagenome TaxID=412755 RepID=A0A0F8VRC0_9ZZZZ
MAVNKELERPKPVFCPDCRTRDNFERQLKKDIRSVETNKPLWEVWVCGVCGYKAINPKEV